MRLLLYFLIPALFVFLSCQKSESDNQNSPVQFIVDKSTITMAGDINFRDTFSIQSNINWTASIAPSNTTWLKLNVTNGIGNSKIIVTGVERNNTGSSRTATITLTPSNNSFQPTTITVTQLTLGPYLIVDSTSMTFNPTQASTDSINIESNTGWAITPSSNSGYWLTLSKSSGTGNAKIIATAKRNDSGYYRSATLLISPNDTTLVKPVRVALAQGTPGLRTDKTSLGVEGYVNSSDSFLVYNNLDWTASTTASWLSLKIDDRWGFPDKVVAITTSNNTTGAPRIATIVISSPGVSGAPIINVQVTQAYSSYTIPTLTTTPISNIQSTTATIGGNVSSDGGATVTARGVCWSTSANPTILNSPYTNNGTGTGGYSGLASNLSPNTTYFVRAYATNNIGTAYGNQVSFTTGVAPVVTTAAVSNITSTSATAGGNVISEGSSPVTLRGVCYGTNPNPVIETIGYTTTTIGVSGTGNFTLPIKNLQINTTYYARAFAKNSQGTSYGNQVSFTTQPALPVVVTGNATGIDTYNATCSGQVISEGSSPVIVMGIVLYDNQGRIVADQSCWCTGARTFGFHFTNLKQNASYTYRAYARSNHGTSYGDLREFGTAPVDPDYPDTP